MKYSQEFKEKIVQKVLSGQKVKAVAQESGVTGWSIYQWIKQHSNGTLSIETTGPRGLSFEEKHNLLLESQTIPVDKIGEWLRRKGIHSDHLVKWKKEIENAMNKNSKEKIENKKLREEIVILKKELKRKDKALAEAAVLLTLKKKYHYLWEDEEK